ncbi:hypothetical protein AB205_0077140 [Aquarana catesbeiana]|uniref:Uncharacterized protein n=1 Tax=Aquarana catesbeiana TaxID=8400 RepID=A0A2G9SKM1_AQUCT|nr:hypothetical protein AB205_0077140 [Aquarana catesbeiana]
MFCGLISAIKRDIADDLLRPDGVHINDIGVSSSGSPDRGGIGGSVLIAYQRSPPSDPTQDDPHAAQDHQDGHPHWTTRYAPSDHQGNANLCQGSCQSMPRQLPISAHSQCLPLPVPPGMPISATYQCRVSVPISATYQCPSVRSSAAYQCPSVPSSATYQCSSVPPYQCPSVKEKTYLFTKFYNRNKRKTFIFFKIFVFFLFV